MEPVDLLMAGVAALVLGMCWCLYHGVTLLTGSQVAVAHVWRGGYSDLERLDDFVHLQQSIGTLRGFDIRDGGASAGSRTRSSSKQPRAPAFMPWSVGRCSGRGSPPACSASGTAAMIRSASLPMARDTGSRWPC
ncbi:hypothetical protein [Novosphingobium subterraneum]|uniref:hypothetical protein n=1 Tax=Novosphingobium subterraneum TaxID=48936 RepID=UPI000A3EC5ED|nr:hypothetical protein [Novosphingobium subterraneum]